MPQHDAIPSQHEQTQGGFRKAASVYVHVPFCAQRCGYCNFALVANRDYLIERFLDSLAVEMDRTIQNTAQPLNELQTVYFGGGTPSHLDCRQLSRLFEIVFRPFQLRPSAEISVEVNPNDLDDSKTAILKEHGVNRISFGVQSFDADKLRKLERSHTAADSVRAVDRARSFAPSVSIDLIFGIAGETPAIWESDLQQALSLPVDHVSTYALTIEKGTSFASRKQKGESVDVSEDQSGDLFEQAIGRLASDGFVQYEISSFARSGHVCRHNQGYWNLQPYFAFGPGAASFDGRVRRRNHPSPSTYLRRLESGRSAVHFEEFLSDELLARERLIFGMRQLAGIDVADFESRTGFPLSTLIPGHKLAALLEQNLIQICNGRLSLTAAGVLVSDSIWVEFL